MRALVHLALLAFACTTPRPEPPPPAEDLVGGRTHVLLVVIDTLRADHVGAWGYPWPTTPHLDQLAAGSVRVDAMWTTSSWTRPAMGSLLTGEYPRSLGLYEEAFDTLPAEAITLAERLSERGYATLGATANPNVNSVFGFDQGFSRHEDSRFVFRFMDQSGGCHRRVGTGDFEDATTLTDRALALVDEHLEPASGAPFYLQLLYIDPHRPRDPPRPHRRAVRGSPDQDYDGEVHYVDAQIHRLLDGLADRGALQDTLVVVTADHGEGLGSHPGMVYSEGHGWYLYDSVLHVPLILSHPALPAGHVVEGDWSMVDLVPTVMDLLGWPVQGTAGRSFAGAITQRAAVEPRTHVFAETSWRVGHKTAVRSGSRKLIHNPDARAWQEQGVHEGRELSAGQRRFLEEVPAEELYLDPGQVREVPDNSVVDEHPGLVEELRAQLAEWERSTPAREPQNRDPGDVVTLADGTVVAAEGADDAVDIDPDVIRALEALGYLR